MTSITIMRVGQPPEVQEVSLAKRPTYWDLRAIIAPLLDHGAMEPVTVLVDGQWTDMFADEAGALKGLPRNEAATAIYRNNWLTRRPDDDPESLPAIYGPAVLFSRRVWF